MSDPQGQELLQSLVRDLGRCNKCGFCMAGCPTYRVNPVEWLVTRGRVSLVQDAVDGTLPVLETAAAVETCLLCRACLDHCPPKVPIDHLMTRTRAAMRRERPLPWLARFILRGLLPRPGLLRAVARAGAVAERLGLRRLALRSGLLRRWPTLERATRVGPRLPGTTARRLLGAGPRPAAAPVRARVAYYVTCTRDVIMPAAARSAVRVLEAAGCQVLLPQVPCCGLPCHSAGDLEGARMLGRRQLAILGPLEVDAIIIDDASCAAHLVELPELFRGQPEEADARALAARCKDLATFLAALGLPPALRPVAARVTWHDPCSLKHHLKVAEAPRRLLRAVPGVTFVEAADADVCCGGAGSFMLTKPDLSDQLLDLKVAAFRATGADFLVTSSPSCLMQLGRGAGEQAPAPRVLSLAEFLEKAYCT